MNITYKIIGANIIDICPLDEIKNYLRITHEDDNKLLLDLEKSAIEYAERFTGLSLYERKIESLVNNHSGIVKLNYTPILKLNKIIAISNDQELKIDPIIDHNIYEGFISIDKKYSAMKLRIRYDGGYKKDDIPYPIKHGILMHIASIYEEGNASLNQRIKELYLPFRKQKI